MKRVSDPDLLKWLNGRLVADDSITGYEATGWEADVWILHAMYETKQLPAGISHDDVRRVERAASVVEDVDGVLAEVLADATLIGSCSSGQYGWPGPGWDRLEPGGTSLANGSTSSRRASSLQRCASRQVLLYGLADRSVGPDLGQIIEWFTTRESAEEANAGEIPSGQRPVRSGSGPLCRCGDPSSAGPHRL